MSSKAHHKTVKRNPEARRDPVVEAVIAKAKDWFGDDSLLTPPELVDYQAPKAAVQIGRLVAIEYESDKFDGKSRIYRHECDHAHELAVSIDGKTFIVFPPLRVTRRGLEG
jgi:hypothetical protein